jgi:hypothetical protein
MGTITISYSGSPGGVATELAASATVSDADAADVLAWMMTVRAPPSRSAPGKPPAKLAPATTVQQAFANYAAGIVEEMGRRVLRWKQAKAAAAATANIAPPVIKAA